MNKLIISLPLFVTLAVASWMLETGEPPKLWRAPYIIQEVYGQDFLFGGDPNVPLAPQEEQQQQQQQPPPVAVTTAAPQAQVPEGFLEYRSPVFGAVINYPSDWEVRPPSNTVRGFSLFQVFAPEGEQGSFTGDRPNLNLEVAEERGAMASYEARAWLEERAFRLMTQHEQFEITESAPTTVAGREGWTLSVTFTSLLDGEEYTNKQWMVGTGGRTYLLTYHSPVESFDEYLPQVQQMIASFRVE